MGFLSKLKGFVAPALTAVGTAFGGPLGGALGAAVGGMVAGKNATSGAKLQQPFQPINVNSPYGNIQTNAGGTSVTGFDTSLGDAFSKFGKQGLEQAGGINPTMPGAAPFDVLQALGLGGPGALGGTEQSRGFDAAGQNALDALGNFDPNAFAQQQYDRLTNLTRPQEQRTAADLADRLFSRGRLGRNDTTAGRAFGDLSLAESQAADSRGIQALGLANTEQTRLGQQAQQFGQLGGNLAHLNAGNINTAFGTARDDQFNLLKNQLDARTSLAAGATAGSNAVASDQKRFADLATLGQNQQSNYASALVGATNANSGIVQNEANTSGQFYAGVTDALTKFGQPKPGAPTGVNNVIDPFTSGGYNPFTGQRT